MGSIYSIAFRSATVTVLNKPWPGLTTLMEKDTLAILFARAEDERERISSRANEGRQLA